MIVPIALGILLVASGSLAAPPHAAQQHPPAHQQKHQADPKHTAKPPAHPAGDAAHAHGNKASNSDPKQRGGAKAHAPTPHNNDKAPHVAHDAAHNHVQDAHQKHAAAPAPQQINNNLHHEQKLMQHVVHEMPAAHAQHHAPAHADAHHIAAPAPQEHMHAPLVNAAPAPAVHHAAERLHAPLPATPAEHHVSANDHHQAAQAQVATAAAAVKSVEQVEKAKSAEAAKAMEAPKDPWSSAMDYDMAAEVYGDDLNSNSNQQWNDVEACANEDYGSPAAKAKAAYEAEREYANWRNWVAQQYYRPAFYPSYGYEHLVPVAPMEARKATGLPPHHRAEPDPEAALAVEEADEDASDEDEDENEDDDMEDEDAGMTSAQRQMADQVHQVKSEPAKMAKYASAQREKTAEKHQQPLATHGSHQKLGSVVAHDTLSAKNQPPKYTHEKLHVQPAPIAVH